MQEEGSEQEYLRLCRLVATLLWLVSVWTPPERGASNRRAVMHMFHGMLLARIFNTQFCCKAIYDLLGQFENPALIQKTGTFVTQLWTTFNAQDDRTGAYHQRDRLRRLLFDILANPSSMVTSNNEEELSTLTCHHDGITVRHPRLLTRARPNTGGTTLEAAAMPPAAVNDDDSFAGGLAISEENTPQDGSRPEDIIVAEFRVGNYAPLEQAHQPDAVIAALSSSLAVMRSLLANPAGGVAASSLEAQEGVEDEEGKEENEEGDPEEANDGAP